MPMRKKELGRPLNYESLQDDAMDVYCVRLTAWHARKSRGFSDEGIFSEGIRLAIEEKVKSDTIKNQSTR